MKLLLWLWIPTILFSQEISNITPPSSIITTNSNIVTISDNINNLSTKIELAPVANPNEITVSEELPINTSKKTIYSYPFSGAEIFTALIKSYPTIITSVSKENNPYHPELAINIRGTNFYNIEGRILPDNERKNWKKYASNSFYIYSKEIPNPLARTAQELKDLRHRGSKSYRKNKKNPQHQFYEAIYGMDSIADTNKQIIKTRFLKKQVLIHRFAFKPLKQVEKEIYALTNNPIHKGEVLRFLKEGDTVYSFFWRQIAGTKSRSLHSYGVAVDILKENTTKAMYWLWRQNQKIDWVKEPISVRWNPPHSVVEIFEKYGFIWGGKWNFYDTMHFEYKPEILLLNNYDVTLIPLDNE